MKFRAMIFRDMTIIVLCILALLLFSKATEAGDVEISTDASVCKTVSSGEDAMFYWDIFNNGTHILECAVETTSKNTEFSDTNFTLLPGEGKNVTHICHTSVSDENGTTYRYWVNWTITNLLGTVECFSSSFLTVKVINQTGFGDHFNDSNAQWGSENGSDETQEYVDVNKDKRDSETFIPGFEAIWVVIALGLCVLLLKRQKK